MKSGILIVALFGLIAISVNAECPNACSGHGSCGQFDMCTCYRNWKGNDCSERVCPYSHAFVTSPQGDLNMDGDHFDNTGKRIVDDETGANALVSISANTDLMTFDTSSTGEATSTELNVNDKIKVAEEIFTVTAIVSAGVSYRLDHRRLLAVSSKPVIRFLNTQASPKGDWEQWPGDFSELGDEGHYYMECSNRGICDTKNGECKCFDGYTGAACQLQSCPGDCSGKGTCETVHTLAGLAPATLQATVSTSKGSTTVTFNTSAPSSLSATGGDTLVIAGKSYTTASTSGVTATLTANADATLPYGTSVAQAMNYKLWDANQARACNCDSAYEGFDCSKRKCPKGDDPLTTVSYDTQCVSTTVQYSAFNQATEKQTFKVDSLEYPVRGQFRLKFTDENGETHTTSAIDSNPMISTSGSVGTGANTVTFTDKPLCSQLGKGDYIQVHNDIHLVASVTKEHTSGVCKISAAATGMNWAAALANYPVFRMNAAVEIRDAILALPNSAVKGVNVGVIAKDGNLMTQVGTISGTTIAPPANWAAPLPGAGMIVNIEGHLRLASAVSLAGGSNTITVLAPGSITSKPVYIHNGVTYSVEFETGCSADADCTANGISIRGGFDSTLSDDNAVCHPAGRCVCSGTSKFGPGCTTDGRGSPKRSVVLSNSGNVEEMGADCGSAYPGIFVGQSAKVTKAAPHRVTFAGALATDELLVGDTIDFMGQRRQVTAREDATPTWVDVSAPFTAHASLSDSTHHIVAKSPVYKVHDTSVSCTSTDQPQLMTDTGTSLFDVAGKTVTADASGNIRDYTAVNIGDRVLVRKSTTDAAIRTVDGFTGAGHTRTAFTVGELFTDCSGTSATIANTAIYVVQQGTTESLTCSRRGLCEESSGLCKCFAGYTSYNCARQNALSV